VSPDSKNDPARRRAQRVAAESDGRRVVVMDASVYADERNTPDDVIVASSYAGVTPVRMLMEIGPRGFIGHDACGDRHGGAVAGLAYLEALGVPSAAADGMTAELGNGEDLYLSGVVSIANETAISCGVEVGMPVSEAAEALMTNDPRPSTSEVSRERDVVQTAEGRSVVVTDSILFAGPEDRDRNVLVVGGFTGRTSVEFFLHVSPLAFIASDGGRAKNDSGIVGLAIAETAGLPGASVDAKTAPMGDGMAAYRSGVISAVNKQARDLGVVEGMTVAEAATRLLAGAAGP